MNIFEIDFRKPVRDYIRKTLMKAVLGTLENQDEPVGFVLVMWDDRARCTISYDAIHSPVPTRLLPYFIQDAIHGQIIADDTAYRWGIDRDEPDGGA